MNTFLSALSSITIIFASTLSAEKINQSTYVIHIEQDASEEIEYQDEFDNQIIDEEYAFEEEEENDELRMSIYSRARPEVCTAFKEIQVLNNSKVVITLSDGSQWDIKENSDAVFEAIYKSWRVGDDIRLQSFSKVGTRGFLLANVREGSVYVAHLSKKCADISNALFIKRVDSTGYAIITTDGRMWVTGYLGACKAQYWSEAQRVIVNKSNHGSCYEDYEIIHLNNGASIWFTQVFCEEDFLLLDMQS